MARSSTAGEVVGDSRPPTGHRRDPHAGRILLAVGYGFLLVVAAVTAVLRFGSGNPDFFYYQAMALQYSGLDYPQARDAVGAANDWFAGPITVLDHGFMSPLYAPLIYPRYLIAKVLSLAWNAGGLTAMEAAPVVLGLVLLVGMVWFAWRRFGPIAAASVPVLALTTAMFFHYAFGPYTEVLVLLILLAILALLPIGRPVSGFNAVSVAALILLLATARQIPQLPVLLIGAGWLHATVTTRRWRNEWTAFLAVGGVAAAVGYLLVSRWAPYDPIPYLYYFYGIDTSLAAWLPGHLVEAGQTLVHDWRTLPTDAVVAGLALVGAWMLRRTVWPWLWAATIAAAVTNLALNRPEYRFWAPSVLIGLLLAAVACSGGMSWARRRWAGTVAEPAEPPVVRPVRPVEAGHTARTWPAALVATCCSVLTVGVGAALVADHQMPTVRSSVPVADLVPAGTLVGYGVDPAAVVNCAGSDAAVWLVEPDGDRYAVTGTAAKRLFGAPTVLRSLPWPHVGLVGNIEVPQGLEGFFADCRAAAASSPSADDPGWG